MKNQQHLSYQHYLFPGAFLLAFLFLSQVTFHARAQEKTVIPIFIVVPGINDDGGGLIDLVNPWAYGQDSSPPSAWTLNTDQPATLQAEDLQSVFESGVRVINVDMDIGIFSPTGSYQQEWREQTGLASDLLVNLTQGFQSLNQASDSVEYRAVVLAHSAGTVAVADSWQEGAVYDKAILLSPRFRVDIMANLARSAGLNANSMLVVTEDGDYARSILQPEPEVRPENRFFPRSKAGYGHPDFAGISYTHLNITGWDTEVPNDPHTDMILHAIDDYAWLTGAEQGVRLAPIYQEFIETREPNQETGLQIPDLPAGSDGLVNPTQSAPPPFFPPGCPPFCPPGGPGIAVISHLLGGDQSVEAGDPGGIDFSSVELDYFTEAVEGEESYIGVVFEGNLANPGETVIQAKETAETTSDAFFAWLALPAQTFWVNLNPNEPDRVIDSELGMTNAGRIMLEADFQMKKTVASLLHPDNELGKQFWDEVYGYIEEKNLTSLCFSFRQWIVPGEVIVWETADSLYILEADLDVKLESEYLELKGETTSPLAGCPADTDPALQALVETRFREMILPELTRQVNTAPEYQDLRSIYRARILAEWYLTKHLSGERDEASSSSPPITAFADFSGQGRACNCYATSEWSPQGLFDQYVQSISQGEFNLTKQEQWQEGDTIYTSTRSYFYGGVDFTRIAMISIPFSQLEQRLPEVALQIMSALLSPLGFQDQGLAKNWFGALYLSSLNPEEYDPVVSESGKPDQGSGGDVPTQLPGEDGPEDEDSDSDSDGGDSPTATPDLAVENPAGGLCRAGLFPLFALVWIGWYRARKKI